MIEQVMALKYIVAAIVYSALGIGILIISFFIFDWLTPHKLWEEIVDNKNLPLAIALGATTLGVAQIIASAIHG
jgi:putative membrane protein